MNLTDLTNLLQGGDALAHNRNLPWAIKNLLDGNRGGVASVDFTLVIMNGCEDTTFIKHTPVIFDKSDEGRRIFGGEVGYIKFRPELFSVKLLGISVIECGIIDVKGQGRELLAPQNDTTVDIV
jgi:hypothetical protein